MEAEIGSTTAGETVKGDIYLRSGDSVRHHLVKDLPSVQGREGLVFQLLVRDMSLEELLMPTFIGRELDDETKGEGYYLIRSRIGSMHGLLVIPGTDQETLVEALRKSYGPGTVMLEERSCKTCGWGMECVNPDGCYRCLNCGATEDPAAGTAS